MSTQGEWFEESRGKASTADEVRAARWAQESAEATLHEVVREAAAAGVSERDLAEASGISRTKVRRIIGREKP